MLRFCLVFLMMAAVLTLGTLAQLHHEALRKQQVFHGWDRAVQIRPVDGRVKVELAKPSPDDVIASFMAPFNLARVVSAPALAQLRALPAVESVHRVMEYTMLSDAAARPVTVHVMDADFIDAFLLGNAKNLSTELSIAAASGAEAQAIANRYPEGELVLRRIKNPGVSPQAEAQIDATPEARQKLGSSVFAPRPLWTAGQTQFYVAAQWMDVPNSRSGLPIPEMSAIVKLRLGVPMAAALRDIQAILDGAPSPLVWKGLIARAQPLLDGWSVDKTRLALLQAGRWIPLATAAALALCAVGVIWLRFRGLLLELSLRRGFGQTKWVACRATLRPELLRLGIAAIAAGAVAWLWFAVQGQPWAAPRMWPTAAGGVALGAGLALLLARALVQRPVALLLKSQTN